MADITRVCVWLVILAMVHCVELCSDVYQVCLTHALSTEKEEVMGLLMGEVTT